MQCLHFIIRKTLFTVEETESISRNMINVFDKHPLMLLYLASYSCHAKSLFWLILRIFFQSFSRSITNSDFRKCEILSLDFSNSITFYITKPETNWWSNNLTQITTNYFVKNILKIFSFTFWRDIEGIKGVSWVIVWSFGESKSHAKAGILTDIGIL